MSERQLPWEEYGKKINDEKMVALDDDKKRISYQDVEETVEQNQSDQYAILGNETDKEKINKVENLLLLANKTPKRAGDAKAVVYLRRWIKTLPQIPTIDDFIDQEIIDLAKICLEEQEDQILEKKSELVEVFPTDFPAEKVKKLETLLNQALPKDGKAGNTVALDLITDWLTRQRQLDVSPFSDSGILTVARLELNKFIQENSSIISKIEVEKNVAKFDPELKISSADDFLVATDKVENLLDLVEAKNDLIGNVLAVEELRFWLSSLGISTNDLSDQEIVRNARAELAEVNDFRTKQIENQEALAKSIDLIDSEGKDSLLLELDLLLKLATPKFNIQGSNLALEKLQEYFQIRSSSAQEILAIASERVREEKSRFARKITRVEILNTVEQEDLNLEIDASSTQLNLERVARLLSLSTPSAERAGNAVALDRLRQWLSWQNTGTAEMGKELSDRDVLMLARKQLEELQSPYKSTWNELTVEEKLNFLNYFQEQLDFFSKNGLNEEFDKNVKILGTYLPALRHDSLNNVDESIILEKIEEIKQSIQIVDVPETQQQERQRQELTEDNDFKKEKEVYTQERKKEEVVEKTTNELFDQNNDIQKIRIIDGYLEDVYQEEDKTLRARAIDSLVYLLERDHPEIRQASDQEIIQRAVDYKDLISWPYFSVQEKYDLLEDKLKKAQDKNLRAVDFLAEALQGEISAMENADDQEIVQLALYYKNNLVGNLIFDYEDGLLNKNDLSKTVMPRQMEEKSSVALIELEGIAKKEFGSTTEYKNYKKDFCKNIFSDNKIPLDFSLNNEEVEHLSLIADLFKKLYPEIKENNQSLIIEHAKLLTFPSKVLEQNKEKIIDLILEQGDVSAELVLASQWYHSLDQGLIKLIINYQDNQNDFVSWEKIMKINNFLENKTDSSLADFDLLKNKTAFILIHNQEVEALPDLVKIFPMEKSFLKNQNFSAKDFEIVYIGDYSAVIDKTKREVLAVAKQEEMADFINSKISFESKKEVSTMSSTEIFSQIMKDQLLADHLDNYCQILKKSVLDYEQKAFSESRFYERSLLDDSLVEANEKYNWLPIKNKNFLNAEERKFLVDSASDQWSEINNELKNIGFLKLLKKENRQKKSKLENDLDFLSEIGKSYREVRAKIKNSPLGKEEQILNKLSEYLNESKLNVDNILTSKRLSIIEGGQLERIGKSKQEKKIQSKLIEENKQLIDWQNNFKEFLQKNITLH